MKIHKMCTFLLCGTLYLFAVFHVWNTVLVCCVSCVEHCTCLPCFTCGTLYLFAMFYMWNTVVVCCVSHVETPI